MITKEDMLWSFIKFSQLILQGNDGDHMGEFACGYWGLKGWDILRYNVVISLLSVLANKCEFFFREVVT